MTAEVNPGLESDDAANADVLLHSFAPTRSDTRIPWWRLLAGLSAGVLLTSLYIGIVTLAQGFDHAVELLVGDWFLVIPIVVGFGVQVGLFVYVRTSLRLRRGARSTKALAGAGTGTSTASVVACCAHHVADVLRSLVFPVPRYF